MEDLASLVDEQLSHGVRHGLGVTPNTFWAAPTSNKDAEYKAAYWLAWAARASDVSLLTRARFKKEARYFFDQAENRWHLLPVDRRTAIYQRAVDVLKPHNQIPSVTHALQAFSRVIPDASFGVRVATAAAERPGEVAEAVTTFASDQQNAAAALVHQGVRTLQRKGHQAATKAGNALVAQAKAKATEYVRTIAIRGALILATGIALFGTLWLVLRRRGRGR